MCRANFCFEIDTFFAKVCEESREDKQGRDRNERERQRERKIKTREEEREIPRAKRRPL